MYRLTDNIKGAYFAHQDTMAVDYDSKTKLLCGGTMIDFVGKIEDELEKINIDSDTFFEAFNARCILVDYDNASKFRSVMVVGITPKGVLYHAPISGVIMIAPWNKINITWRLLPKKEEQK